MWIIDMASQPESDPTTPSALSNTTDAPEQASPPGEPAVERSRFSQWLASFGLGELQNPLLTRTRPPAPRSRS
jgi:hypothetical protein